MLLGSSVLSKGKIYAPVLLEIIGHFKNSSSVSKTCSVKFMKMFEDSWSEFKINSLQPDDLKILADMFRDAYDMTMARKEPLDN